MREIEINRATLEDLQPEEPGQYWRLYVHGKGRLMADEWVKVLPEVHAKIQAYLACRGGALPPSAPLFATTASVEADGTAPSSQVQRKMRHKQYGTTEHYVRESQQRLEGAEGAITQI